MTAIKELYDWINNVEDETAFNKWQIRKGTIIKKIKELAKKDLKNIEIKDDDGKFETYDTTFVFKYKKDLEELVK